jgi:hypothetical protein
MRRMNHLEGRLHIVLRPARVPDMYSQVIPTTFKLGFYIFLVNGYHIVS